MAELFIEKLAKEIAEKALDEYKYKGKTIREWADLLSNGDVVEVVRCKDCKFFHRYKDNCKDAGTYCDQLYIYGVRPDGFCSYGERKEK